LLLYLQSAKLEQVILYLMHLSYLEIVLKFQELQD